MVLRLKSQTWMIISILVIIIIVGLVILGIVAVKRGWIKTDKTSNTLPNIEYYIAGTDIETEELIMANYLLLSNNTRITSGITEKEVYTPLTVVNNLSYELSCWSDEYYLGKVDKTFSGQEKRDNKSKTHCKMEKIGNLSVSHRGGIEAKSNRVIIDLELKDGTFKKMGMCFAWSTGIIDVVLDDIDVKCDKGTWKNWSKYDRETETYIYLEDDYYRCGDDWFEQCESTYSNRCKLKQIETPSRFLGVTDFCQYTARSYKANETDKIEMIITTLGNMRMLDYLEITFFDHDERWDREWKTVNEINELDIAAKDVKYTIDYRG